MGTLLRRHMLELRNKKQRLSNAFRLKQEDPAAHLKDLFLIHQIDQSHPASMVELSLTEAELIASNE